MTQVVRLDYETYSECDLRACGLWRYAEDPSTEVLCFAFRIGAAPVRVWRIGDKFPPDLKLAILEGAQIRGWNVNFERAITELVASRTIGFPVPRVDQWSCTMAKAAQCAMPRALEVCARVMKLVEQKDPAGKKLLAQFSVPRRPTKANPSTRIRPADAPEDYARLIEYCRQDVVTEQAIDEALPDLPPREQLVWTTDSVINARGIPLDLPMLDGAISLVGVAQSIAGRELAKITAGPDPEKVVTSAAQSQRFKAWAETQGVTLGSLDKEHLPAVLAMNLPANVRRAIDIKAEAGASSTAKYQTMRNTVCADGRVRGTKVFDGADTGRWTGKYAQFDNLPRPDFDMSCYLPELRRGSTEWMELVGDRPMKVLRDSVRHVVAAGPGKTFVICDLAAIEARVLGWMADEPFYMNAYRAGKNLYLEMGYRIYRRPITKKGDPIEYLVSKEAVLGLGYSMWKDTFEANVIKKSGKRIPRELTDKAVEIYRQECKEVVRFWSQVEKCALACISTRKTLKYKCFTMRMEGTFFTIELPSGRRLFYPEAHIKMGMKWGRPQPTIRYKTNLADGEKWEWFTIDTYGGKLTENLDQAIARDVLAEALIKCEERGLPTVMHVHDEIVAEVDTDRAEEAATLLRATMIEALPWAPGLPLDAEVFISPFYKK